MGLFVPRIGATWLLTLLAACFARAEVQPSITALCFSDDGNSLITGSQSGIEVFHWPSLKLDKSIPTSLKHVHDIQVSDGVIICAGGAPSDVGEIEMRRWPDGLMLSQYSSGGDLFYSIALNNQFLAIASGDHKVRILDRKRESLSHELDRHSRRVLSVEFLPTVNGDSFVVSAGADHTLRVWNAKTGELVRNLDNHTDIVRDLAIRPSTAGLPLIASASADSTVRFWQPTIGRLVRFAKLPSEPLAITWLSGGKLVAAACMDGKLRIIDADTVKTVSTSDAVDGWAYSIAAHPTSNEVAIGGSGGQLHRVTISVPTDQKGRR